MESIAGKQSPSGVAAGNILQFINQTDYPEVFDAELTEDLRLISQENSNSIIQIFPNPADNTLTVSISNWDSEKHYILKAYTISGNLMFETKVNDAVTTIQISKWSSGMYLCEISADGEIIFMEKLVKE